MIAQCSPRAATATSINLIATNGGDHPAHAVDEDVAAEDALGVVHGPHLCEALGDAGLDRIFEVDHSNAACATRILRAGTAASVTVLGDDQRRPSGPGDVLDDGREVGGHLTTLAFDPATDGVGRTFAH
jgi:hypothetical protein